MPLVQPLTQQQYVYNGDIYYIGSYIALTEDGARSHTRADRNRWRYKVLKRENNQWIIPDPPTMDILLTSTGEWGIVAPANDEEFGGNRPPEPGDNVLDTIRGPIQLGGKRRKFTKKRRSKKRKSTKKRKSKRKKRSKRR
jgi:hypothetical protein